MTAPRAKLDCAIAATLFATGFAIVFRTWLFTGFDGIFGDEGDGEIAIAIVEHWHRVFAGAAHWPDPSFFYPERGTLGFTDALFLYGLVHAALRAVGFDVFTSIMIIMAALAAIGFFGFLRLARRHFGLSMPWAALGAFLFAFANMNAVKMIHAQAYAAMLLPVLCDLVLTAWKAEGRSKAAVLVAIAGLLHGLLFITAFQTAWFFTLFLVLFAALYPVVFGLAATRVLLKEARAKWHVTVAYAVAFVVGVVPFLMLYLPVLLSGRHRELSEIFGNSPDARDIVNVTPFNWVWGELLRMAGITGRPARPVWEVELGFTPGVFLALLGTVAVLMMSIRRAPGTAVDRDRWIVVFGLGVLISWLVQIDYFGFRPWSIVWALVPGAGGIRYTFRSQIVANLFAALVVARALHGLAALARVRGFAPALVAAVALFLAVEQVNVQWPASISRRKQIAILDAIPPAPVGCRAFYLVPGAAPTDKQGWEHQAQAMMISQVRGIATINGYSSWLPEGWDLEEPSAKTYPGAVRTWAATKGIAAELCGLDPLKGQWTAGLPR